MISSFLFSFSLKSFFLIPKKRKARGFKPTTGFETRLFFPFLFFPFPAVPELYSQPFSLGFLSVDGCFILWVGTLPKNKQQTIFFF